MSCDLSTRPQPRYKSRHESSCKLPKTRSQPGRERVIIVILEHLIGNQTVAQDGQVGSGVVVIVQSGEIAPISSFFSQVALALILGNPTKEPRKTPRSSGGRDFRLLGGASACASSPGSACAPQTPTTKWTHFTISRSQPIDEMSPFSKSGRGFRGGRIRNLQGQQFAIFFTHFPSPTLQES